MRRQRSAATVAPMRSNTRQGAGPAASCGQPRPSLGSLTDPAWRHGVTTLDVAMCTVRGGRAVTARTAPTIPRL